MNTNYIALNVIIFLLLFPSTIFFGIGIYSSKIEKALEVKIEKEEKMINNIEKKEIPKGKVFLTLKYLQLLKTDLARNIGIKQIASTFNNILFYGDIPNSYQEIENEVIGILKDI